MEVIVTYMKFILLITLCSAAQLPDGITKCAQKDADVDKCIMDQSVIMIPKIINGADDLHIPNLNPLKLKEIEIAATDSLKIKLVDIEVKGLDKAEFKKITTAMDKGTCTAEVFIEELAIEGTYDIDGQILVLPITGNGPAHIKFDKVLFTFSFSWDMIDQGGDQFADVKEGSLTYTTDRQHYVFDNLFNGDKALGDEMNKFLDENWESFGKDISPAVSKVISDTILDIFRNVGHQVAWKDLWSDS